MHRALRVALTACVLSACGSGSTSGEEDPTGIAVTFDRASIEVCTARDARAVVRLTATLSSIPEDVAGALVVVQGDASRPVA